MATALDALAKNHTDLSLTLLTRKWQRGDQRHRVIECNPIYFGRLLRDYSFSCSVQSVLQREHFDLVQSHERIAGCDIFRAGDGVHAAWLEQRARQQGVVARIANECSPWHHYTLAAERAMFADPRLRAVICNSELVRADIVRHYGVPDHKLHVIYNGVDLDRFRPRLADEHRQGVRKQFSVPENMPFFIYVGSGFERKGVGNLLRAFVRMGTKESRLMIVGRDKNAKDYQVLANKLGIEDRVIFTGGVDDVRPLYAAADVFVMPTLYEPLSNAVLEALACGLPCVVSNQSGAAELVCPGVNGDVCDAFDIEGISHAMEQIAHRAATMRIAAREAVVPYGVDAMTEKLMALYKTLL